MNELIGSERQQRALEYALNVIKKSAVSSYVKALYLYGSCARGEERWESDVDLFMELSSNVLDQKGMKEVLRLLPYNIKLNSYTEASADLKIVIGNAWRQSGMLFYEDIREEGIEIWS